ncbi:hypothetical protein ABGB14_30215 [Nonomuraea sp. B10E15]|uniref:hypothetical protein n=1 Tax=Nonomuraea sp. B10E15 TaxID=3153560 RepID=UPI00325DA5A8
MAYDLIALIQCEPLGPRASLDPDPLRGMWQAATAYMPLGRDAGQVVSDPDAPDERRVCKRERCRRRGAAVRTWQLASRTAYACPVGQSG